MFHSIFLGRDNSNINGCPYAVQNTSLQIGTYYTTTQTSLAYGLNNYSISGNIYLGSDIGSGKNITGLQFQPTGYTTPFVYSSPQEIWIGQISNSTFPTTTPAVDFSDLTFTKTLTKVKGAFSLTIPSNNVWQSITFDTPYCWDGTNNLLLVWKNYDGSWSSGYGNVQVANVVSRNMWKGNDASFPTGNGTRTNFPLLVKFNY